jgi:hypothetical protein
MRVTFHPVRYLPDLGEQTFPSIPCLHGRLSLHGLTVHCSHLRVEATYDIASLNFLTLLARTLNIPIVPFAYSLRVSSLIFAVCNQ